MKILGLELGLGLGGKRRAGETTDLKATKISRAGAGAVTDHRIDEDDETAAGAHLRDEHGDAVRKCSDWFEADRTAKREIMDELEDIYKLYKGDHWDVMDNTGRVLRNDAQKRLRPNSVENVTQSLVESLVSEFNVEEQILDVPVERGDDGAATIMTDIKEFIAYKNRLREERGKWLRWYFLYGTGVWHVYWDPSWRGGRGPNRWEGDIRWKAMHPQAIFPDGRCKEDVNEGRRLHKAFYRTEEYVYDKWPDSRGKIEPDVVSHSMLLGDTADIGLAEHGEEQVLVVETWYKGKPLIDTDGADADNEGPGLHVIWWAGDARPVYLGHANYVYFDPGEELEFPFIFRARYPRENSVWGYGEPHFIKSPQIAKNRTAELILEANVHSALGQTFYEDDNRTLTPAQKKKIERQGTLGGMWFGVKDVSGIKREHGRGAPMSLYKEVDRLERYCEKQMGRYDITRGETPGQITAFRALDLLAKRAQVRLQSAEVDIETATEDCGNYINNLVFRYYTQRRAYRILGNDAEETRYGLFQADDYKKVYLFDLDESIPYRDFLDSGAWAISQMEEGRDYEVYCPSFDVRCKVTRPMPTDRIFYMEMAKELLAGGLVDEETFWYVMAYGKFPPFDELLEGARARKEEAMRIREQEQLMNAANAAQAAQSPVSPGRLQAAGAAGPGAGLMPGAGTGGMNITPEMVIQYVREMLAQSNPAMLREFDALTPEQQLEFAQQLITSQGGPGAGPGAGPAAGGR